MDELNFNKLPDTSTTGSSVSYSSGTDYFDPQYCMYRLPCGYCTKLEKPCPMTTQFIPWNGGPVITYCKEE